jgi:hypothetical protein
VLFQITSHLTVQIRAIADESVRVTGRQQNDIARLDSSLGALSAAVSDADLRRDRDAAGASVGDVERVPRFENVCAFIHLTRCTG